MIFLVHPRTRLSPQKFGLDMSSNGKIYFFDSPCCLEFIALKKKVAFVVTDSGGIQEGVIGASPALQCKMEQNDDHCCHGNEHTGRA